MLPAHAAVNPSSTLSLISRAGGHRSCSPHHQSPASWPVTATPLMQVVTPRRVVLAGTRDAARANGTELRFHRGHADMARPLAAYVAAGVSHTSVLTATGAVLVWRSDDPQLLVREVQGGLAGGWLGWCDLCLHLQCHASSKHCWGNPLNAT